MARAVPIIEALASSAIELVDATPYEVTAAKAGGARSGPGRPLGVRMGEGRSRRLDLGPREAIRETGYQREE